MSTLPFSRAYDFLLEDKELTPAEKLVMIEVCRYWPNPYWATNEHIAKKLGFSERYIEKLIKRLAEKKYIKRGYAHTTKNNRPHTVRVIVPKSFPVKSTAKIKWVKLPEHMDGQYTEDMDGNCPNNSPLSPEHKDDLLEKNKNKIEKATPAPLPAGGQALALGKNEGIRVIQLKERQAMAKRMGLYDKLNLAAVFNSRDAKQ